MPPVFSSVLLLTFLLSIGLAFFLRAASKDRTTVIEVSSILPPLEVMNGISEWLKERGWRSDGGDADKQLLKFNGDVSSSPLLAIFLSILGGLGGCSFGLVIRQLFPQLFWWPLTLGIFSAPLSGFLYWVRSSRKEYLEIRLLNNDINSGTNLKLRAHRDELIALEIDLGTKLKLVSDGSLLTSPI